jgi:hypothetical protein
MNFYSGTSKADKPNAIIQYDDHQLQRIVDTAVDSDHVVNYSNRFPSENNTPELPSNPSNSSQRSPELNWDEFISGWDVGDDVSLYASRHSYSLSQFLAESPSHLNNAISVMLNEPDSERRSVLISAAQQLSDPQLNSVGEALINSESEINRIDGISLLGNRDSNLLPVAVEKTLKSETDSDVLLIALKWAVNTQDSEMFDSIRSSVEGLALDSTNPQLKQEALAAMLYFNDDSSTALSEIEYLLSSPNEDERNAALYSMSISQSAATSDSALWTDIQSTLNYIVKDDEANFESRLQALYILRDLNTPDES